MNTKNDDLPAEEFKLQHTCFWCYSCLQRVKFDASNQNFTEFSRFLVAAKDKCTLLARQSWRQNQEHSLLARSTLLPLYSICRKDRRIARAIS
ncbi:hypothetical protein Y032_0183g921 [Ancylostoma ceylanicum]|uniref:Uncharacterized protein n=1 Tax=Ancylostoma ceylanicum TaxID=53326 RepID=A0A016SSJ0_9BILA|nr:hypothetical protein Y032_0183g921 [Ancylostoma ceylanicum]